MNARLGTLALGLLALVLLTVIGLELGAGQPGTEDTGIVAVRQPPRVAPRVAADDAQDHTDAWLATVLARPLFSRDRKPTPSEAKASGGPILAALPRLTGVIVGPFGRTAIFAGSEGGKPIAVSEGKSIGAYTIEAIEPGSVTVSGPSGTQQIALSADAKTRDSMAADLQRQAPQVPMPPTLQPGFGPRQGGLPPGPPFNPQLRQNTFSPRAGLPFPGVAPNQRSN